MRGKGSSTALVYSINPSSNYQVFSLDGSA